MRGSDASKRPGARDRPSRAVGNPDANAELAMSLEVRICHLMNYENYSSFLCSGVQYSLSCLQVVQLS
jgi:hypothetical protein